MPTGYPCRLSGGARLKVTGSMRDFIPLPSASGSEPQGKSLARGWVIDTTFTDYGRVTIPAYKETAMDRAMQQLHAWGLDIRSCTPILDADGNMFGYWESGDIGDWKVHGYFMRPTDSASVDLVKHDP